jgi:hypothetical protein
MRRPPGSEPVAAFAVRVRLRPDGTARVSIRVESAVRRLQRFDRKPSPAYTVMEHVQDALTGPLGFGEALNEGLARARDVMARKLAAEAGAR